MALGDGWPGMTGVHGNSETRRKRGKATEGKLRCAYRTALS